MAQRKWAIFRDTKEDRALLDRVEKEVKNTRQSFASIVREALAMRYAHGDDGPAVTIEEPPYHTGTPTAPAMDLGHWFPGRRVLGVVVANPHSGEEENAE